MYLPPALFTYLTSLLSLHTYTLFAARSNGNSNGDQTTMGQTVMAEPNLQTGRRSLEFTLRQDHVVMGDARVLFKDRRASSVVGALGAAGSRGHGEGEGNRGGDDPSPPFHIIHTRRVTRHKPKPSRSSSPSPHSPSSHALRPRASARDPWHWDPEDEVDAPDVERRETLLELAKMTNNAYLEPGESGWYELGDGWNVSYPFGWDPASDGFRGHVFATPDNQTVVLSIKGTSAAFIGGGGPTAKKDKFNDNLLFSCCCARVDWSWTTVCGCWRGSGRCDERCLEEAMAEESLFYPVGTNLYNNITYMYPDSNIWIIGHSLGGALASLLGVTFGAPAVTFESPGERLAAGRLHLPSPPSTHHVTHVYHTADPIAMGTCNGVLSSCALGGYAMETRCHLGKSIVYDTVTNLSWAVDIRTHGITTVIDRLLSQPWEHSEKAGRQVPEAKAEDDCVECYTWEFGDFPEKFMPETGCRTNRSGLGAR